MIDRNEVPLRLCLGCCPASEWHWLRWVLLAQPLLALLLYVWAN